MPFRFQPKLSSSLLNHGRHGLRLQRSYVLRQRDGRWLLVALAESEIPNANRVPSKIDPAVLDAYVGEYQMSPGNILNITRHGDQIFEQWAGDAQPTPDFPLSESNFYQRGQPGVVSFTRSPDGKVDAYVLWLSDSTIVGKKIR